MGGQSKLTCVMELSAILGLGALLLLRSQKLEHSSWGCVGLIVFLGHCRVPLSMSTYLGISGPPTGSCGSGRRCSSQGWWAKANGLNKGLSRGFVLNQQELVEADSARSTASIWPNTETG